MFGSEDFPRLDLEGLVPTTVDLEVGPARVTFHDHALHAERDGKIIGTVSLQMARCTRDGGNIKVEKANGARLEYAALVDQNVFDVIAKSTLFFDQLVAELEVGEALIELVEMIYAAHDEVTMIQGDVGTDHWSFAFLEGMDYQVIGGRFIDKNHGARLLSRFVEF